MLNSKELCVAIEYLFNDAFGKRTAFVCAIGKKKLKGMELQVIANVDDEAGLQILDSALAEIEKQDAGKRRTDLVDKVAKALRRLNDADTN